jgi:hypothetical protein
MMETSTQNTAMQYEVWYRKPGERTWRHSATYPFQCQADTITQRIIERTGDEAKVEAVPREQ